MVTYFLVRERLKNCQKIVIKIGSNALVNKDGFNHETIKDLAKEIALFTNAGKEIILVSSGAIALEKTVTKTTHLSKYFYASIGQKYLIQEYDHCFEETNLLTSQILITKRELKEKESIKKLKLSINHALELGIITIINENDAIAHNSFENNDILAAEIANITNSDLLILLTNTNGIYSCIKSKKTISYATKEKLSNYILRENSDYGTGGMETKLIASEICKNTNTIIASAFEKDILTKILNGKDTGTLIQK